TTLMCSCYGCDMRLFHTFPIDVAVRAEWMQKIQRDHFNPTKNTQVCSRHFKKTDFSVTVGGPQNCLKPHKIPSVFSLKRKAPDHLYALPSCPKAIKAKLDAALATVWKLQREKSNALARERRAKKNKHALLEELKEKNLINEELKEKLECYSGKKKEIH
uniref:THAP-type domain-containing protein n=1 Tax=Acanthochromis polyacanthus TaxID=80966 RepID=A0A3Q1GDW0_9TELE